MNITTLNYIFVVLLVFVLFFGFFIYPKTLSLTLERAFSVYVASGYQSFFRVCETLVFVESGSLESVKAFRANPQHRESYQAREQQ